MKTSIKGNITLYEGRFIILFFLLSYIIYTSINVVLGDKYKRTVLSYVSTLASALQNRPPIHTIRDGPILGSSGRKDLRGTQAYSVMQHSTTCNLASLRNLRTESVSLDIRVFWSYIQNLYKGNVSLSEFNNNEIFQPIAMHPRLGFVFCNNRLRAI